MTSSVTKARSVTTTHTAYVAAPPRAVFRLIAEATRWPFLFPPVVHVDVLDAGIADDRLRLWTVGNGAVRSWVSRRALDREGLRIRFRHESPAAPVASMTGEWVFVPLPGNATSVVLLHEFRAVGDDPVASALIQQAVDRNSTAELAAVKGVAELGDRLPALVHAISDSVFVAGDAAPVYEFLHRVEGWPRWLPSISRLVVDEAVPGVQTVDMETAARDGAQTVRLVRVCFPGRAIVYKQLDPPYPLAAHVGSWTLAPAPGGVQVTAQNTVLDNPPALANGPVPADRTAAQSQQWLRRNCLAVIMAAKDAVERAEADDLSIAG